MYTNMKEKVTRKFQKIRQGSWVLFVFLRHSGQKTNQKTATCILTTISLIIVVRCKIAMSHRRTHWHGALKRY